MRIISGKYKGRKIQAPLSLPVRPTTDFAKTGLFNILQNKIELADCRCLDLFSGTGCISLELLSRNSLDVVSVDKDSGCVNFQKDTQRNLGISNWTIIKSDVLMFLKNNLYKYDLIFADPPFDLDIYNQLHDLIFEKKMLTPEGILVLEHISSRDYSQMPGFNFERKYGNVSFSFFHNFDE